MGHVAIVELMKLKILLDFLLIDIIQYKNIQLEILANFHFLDKFLGRKWALTTPLFPHSS